MKIKLILSASLLCLSGLASAQMATQITDPAKIAEIEAHAQQLGAQPMAQSGDHMDRMDRMHAKHRMHARMRHHKKMMAKRAEMKAMPDNAGAPTQN
jgi:hypothetical protein